jgi:hypothetical protein
VKLKADADALLLQPPKSRLMPTPECRHCSQAKVDAEAAVQAHVESTKAQADLEATYEAERIAAAESAAIDCAAVAALQAQ